ncbi:two-partner secretion domain-containing protein [Almyronema epifaneia]|uniref:Filamentous hemagglutinin N-terminal domain-containing protein n=1 Tax=Almyronema epifaneia S1 TaxID=2991925 RepID=A0ABW6IEU5_9CYAN
MSLQFSGRLKRLQGWGFVGLIWVGLGECQLPIKAQIVPDATLPINSVVPTGCTNCLITGGTPDANHQVLFHSFEQFSIPTGGSAFFQPDGGLLGTLESIVTRVTGQGAISNIDGAIASPVTLFFLNPNGIVLGPNASLTIGGSFIASTADSLQFSGGGTFSAVNPQAPPLLTLSTPVGLQFGGNPEPIVNRSQAASAFPALPVPPGLLAANAGLEVIPGQTLGLFGGAVSLEGGNLTALQGRVEIGSVAGGTVDLTPTFNGFAASYENAQGGGDIRLSQGSQVNVSGLGGGQVQLQGQTVAVLDGSQVLSYTLGNQPGGNIDVNAIAAVEVAGANGPILSGLRTDTLGDGAGGDLNIRTGQLRISDRALLSASTVGQGSGGDLTIRARDLIEISGSSFETLQQTLFLGAIQGTVQLTDAESGLLVGTAGPGAAGQLSLDTRRLVLRDGALISTTAAGSGRGGDTLVNASESVDISGSLFLTGTLQGTTQAAGNLRLDTQRLTLRDGGLLQTFTFGSGAGGDLVVTATESIDLLSTPLGAIVPTGIFANSIFGTGAGGDIAVTTNRLTISGGAQIGNQTGALLGTGLIPFGGPAGDVILTVADTVEISGFSPDRRFLSGPGTTSFSGAPAGDIRLTTGNLTIREGANISTTTLSQGAAGLLTVNAAGVVDLVGRGTINPLGIPVEVPSSLVSSSGRADFPGLVASGAAGSLQITAGELRIRDGAEVAVNSLGTGNAGTVEVRAGLIQLDNQGTITASMVSGAGGDIDLQAQTAVLLRRGSLISTNAGNTDGGNIAINTPFLVAIPQEDSDITANAQQGRGGQVVVTAQGILGTTFREFLTPESEITATSELGPQFNGVVVLNTPDVDPSSGLIELPTNLEDPSDRIVSGCPSDRGNRFVVSGQGGLPPSPTQPLQSPLAWQDWRFLQPETATAPLVTSTVPNRTIEVSAAPAVRSAWVEATGWQVDAAGQVSFISQQPANAAQTAQVDLVATCQPIRSSL